MAKSGREPHDKRDTLRRLIRSDAGLKNAIIFCNRKREVATLYRSLLRHGFSVQALHGDMDQPARTAALEQFRKGEVMLLVASDVAARGLDIPEVSHVYNFDVPHHADDYVHRIGRTGRAGKTGIAITLVAGGDDVKAVAAIEKLIGERISWMGETPGTAARLGSQAGNGFVAPGKPAATSPRPRPFQPTAKDPRPPLRPRSHASLSARRSRRAQTGRRRRRHLALAGFFLRPVPVKV